MTVGRCRALFATFGIRSAPVNKPEAIHWVSRPLRVPGGFRRRVGGTPNTIDSQDSTRAGGRGHAGSFLGAGGTFAERNGAGTGERLDNEREA